MGGRGRPAGPENAPSLFEVKVLRNGRRPPQVTWTFLDQIPFPERRTNAHRHEQQQQQQEEDEEKMGGGGFARPRFDAGSALESLQRFSGPLAGKGKWKRRNAARANQPGPAVEDLSFPLPPPALAPAPLPRTTPRNLLAREVRAVVFVGRRHLFLSSVGAREHAPRSFGQHVSATASDDSV